MSAKLVLLGRLRDVAGADEIEVPAGPLEAVLAALAPDVAAALSGERVRIALNGALLPARGDLVLADGDELAFLPPVSGG